MFLQFSFLPIGLRLLHLCLCGKISASFCFRHEFEAHGSELLWMASDGFVVATKLSPTAAIVVNILFLSSLFEIVVAFVAARAARL